MKKTKDLTNEFKNCVLIQYSIKFYRGKKKLSKAKLARMVRENPAAADWLTGSKSIIDPAEVKKVGKINNKVVAYLNPKNPDSPCLPHPLHGMKIIPIALMEEVDAEMQKFESEFWPTAETFKDRFEEFKEFSKTMYDADGFYNEFEFPDNIDDKFGFTWKYYELSTPDSIKAISMDIYNREKEKVKDELQEVKADCINALRTSFAGMVNHLVEKFTGKKKYKNRKTGRMRTQDMQWHESTIDNFYDFFGYFSDRNVFNDAELQDLVEKAKDVLKGRDAGIVKENDSLKKQIAGEMGEVQKAINELVKKPRRKIDL
jgi:hypothetical protein